MLLPEGDSVFGHLKVTEEQESEMVPSTSFVPGEVSVKAAFQGHF